VQHAAWTLDTWFAPPPSPSPARPRVLWLAVADGRGHLMRAQLMRQLLAPTGIDVEIVTTSDAGAAFISSFGAPCAVVSRDFGIHFDGQQNLRKARTALGLTTYLVGPGRCRADLRWLERRARGAALVVNDSFHPALLVAGLGAGASARSLRGRLVQVYGETLRRAVQGFWGERGWYADAVARALGRSRACIEHTFAAGDGAAAAPGVIRLPPLFALPRRAPAEVKRALGVPTGGRLATVYLNPYFTDPALADALERGLAAAGYTVHAVGEGFASRPGWRARDPELVEAVAAADLFVSAAGMASLGQARTFGVPFLALATAQPEQRANLAPMRDGGDPRCRVVDTGAELAPRLTAAIAALGREGETGPRLDPRHAVLRVQARWIEAVSGLVRNAPTAATEEEPR
jgi:hypothetical protein